MARYIFDLESDGLLDELTTIHCLVLKDVDTGEVISTSSQTLDVKDTIAERLMKADMIIGHNIINFDIPAIQKLYPWFTIDRSKAFDTLVMSRLIWTDLFGDDEGLWRAGTLKGNLRGRHSLKAWGVRLGLLKGDFGDTTKWDKWSPEMQEYCERDVEVTTKLFALIESKKTDPRAIELEHEVAFIIDEQERTGFMFDRDRCLDLLKKLQEERADVESKLQNLFDPWFSFEETVNPPKTLNFKDLTRHSLTAGAEYSKIKLNVFNPGSRAHIADRLKKIRGWVPKEFTNCGQPQVDDEILSALPYPEAKQIAYYLMLQKRIGQIYEGKNSWLRYYNESTGRIHGRVNTNGAVTGRMTHSHPNVAQTPSVGVPYGEECRAVWTVPSGKKLVGVDVSGLELRMLAHFMAPHDGGAYAREVVEGDVHTTNMEAAGLSERAQAKTFISMG